VAERRGIPEREIPDRRPELEREMLEAFYASVREAQGWRWLHWNMASVIFGFPALAQRFEALGGVPVAIPEKRVINLAETLKRALGDDYVPHPRLENLIRLNGLSEHDWLHLEELTAAARAQEFARMLRSLLRRVRCIGSIFELFAQNRLKHNGLPIEICPLRWALTPGPRWLLARAAGRSRWTTSGAEDAGEQAAPRKLSEALGEEGGGEEQLEQPHPNGLEPPRSLWWEGERYEIGTKRSRRCWLLLDYMWSRQRATFQELQGPEKPWEDPVTESAISTAVNRLNLHLPASLPWRLEIDGGCVVKRRTESQENLPA
jgi:hypothetical protein